MQNKPIMKIFKKILTVSLSLLSIQLAAQDTINGTVTDENGSPLPGATILVVGTDEGLLRVLTETSLLRPKKDLPFQFNL